MNQSQSDTTRPDLDGRLFYSVIAVSFEDDDKAYAALTVLKELDSQKQIGLEEAMVVERQPDGRVVEKDRVASDALPNTVGGGLVGLLIGIIGGPLGMLIGGTTGLFIGSLFDINDADETDSALSAISSCARTGHTAVLGVVTEQSREVIDAAMSGLGGTVLRRSVDEVEAEIAAAQEAEREAGHKARKELMRRRRDHSKEAAHAKVEELKAKLRHAEKQPAATT